MKTVTKFNVVALCALCVACANVSRPDKVPLFNDGAQSTQPIGAIQNSKKNYAPPIGQTKNTKNRDAEWSAIGDGNFVRNPGAKKAASTAQNLKEPIDFTFRDADISYVVDFVIGELLSADYVLPPQAQGKVTLSAKSLINTDQVLFVLNSAFEPQGWFLDQQDKLYALKRTNEQKSEAFSPELISPSLQSTPVSGALVFSPCCAAATQLAELVRPFAVQGVSVSVQKDRGLIFITGDPVLAGATADTLKMFDVDWFDAGSVSLIPLENVSPETLVLEIKPILAKSAPDVDVAALPRLDAVVLLSPRKRGLMAAKTWVKRLDRAISTGTNDMLIYQTLNRSASELSAIVSSTNSNDSFLQNEVANNVNSPGTHNSQIAIRRQRGVGVDAGQQTRRNDFGRSFSISVDESQDIIIAQGLPAELQKLHDLLKLLDKPRAQVLIEAVILEVSLTQNDSLGIQWQGREGQVDLLFSNSKNGTIQPRAPGISATYINQDISAIIDALASQNDIEIISSPRLITLSNETARLQIGDQVPIISQSAVNVATSNATLVNTISTRDTGVQLNVTPKVRAGGVVELAVTQEVSDVIQTTSSGIDSPTIRRRSFESTLIVPDGQSVALGGLMSSTVSVSDSGVPFIKDIPLLGTLFKSQNTSRSRTELIVLLRPTILPNPAEAVSATNRLKEALQRLSDRFGVKNESH